MKLKKVKPGRYQIGNTNWFVFRRDGHDDCQNLWETGRDEGKDGMYVYDMHSTKKEAVQAVKKLMRLE